MKIKLKIKNKNVELSTQEAEEIFNQLSKIFGRKVLEQPPYIPQPWDTSPTIPYPNYRPIITCDDLDKKTVWFGDPPGTVSFGGSNSSKSWTSLEDLAWNSIGK